MGTGQVGAGAFKGGGNALEVAIRDPVAVPIENKFVGRAPSADRYDGPLEQDAFYTIESFVADGLELRVL